MTNTTYRQELTNRDAAQTMKAITITEPWASLIMIGAKTIETRSWPTSYRGPIAIHAAKGMTKDDLAFAFDQPIRGLLIHASVFHCSPTWPVRSQFPRTRGRILAIADLVDCAPMVRHAGNEVRIIRNGKARFGEPVPEHEKPLGHYAPGRYAWILANVRPVPERPEATGALSLWDWKR